MSQPWLHRRAPRITAGVLLAGFLALNIVAFLHARAMSWFTTAGERTAVGGSLDDLGRLAPVGEVE